MKTTVQTPTEKYFFSYLRFSSDQQAAGTTIDRQSDAIKEALEEHPEWIYREDWNIGNLTEGISAYKKDNFPILYALVDAAKAGKFPKDKQVVMGIEKINRLTRADLDEAEDLIKAIIRSGIEIYNCKTKELYTITSLKKLNELNALLGQLAEANAYAKEISDNVKKAWKSNRKQIASGKILLKTIRGGQLRRDMWSWIKNTGTGYELNEKAETIDLIFKLYLQGFGAAAIARKLNAAKTPSLAGVIGGWSQSIVYRLLRDRRVLGEMIANGETIKKANGEPVKYYPAAVLEKAFLDVQAKLDDNKGKPSKDKDICNLFAGVSYCRCGERIKVSSGSSTNGKWIYCYGHLDGTNGCKDSMIKYQPFEDCFMNSFLRLKAGEMVKDDNGDRANAQIEILKGRKADAQNQINNIMAFILKGKATDAMVDAQSDLETQVKEIDQQIELEYAKAVALKGSDERLAELLLKLRDVKTDQSVRLEVQGWIRQNINRITLDRPAKEFTIDLKNGKYVQMNLNGTILGTKSFTALFGDHNRSAEEALKEASKTV